MLRTPEGIRTFQRKLYRKAKQTSNYRFYSLYDKVYRADILNHAYHLARANKGSAGIDGVTFTAIEDGEGVVSFLEELEDRLKSGNYKASPVRRVMIPKLDGSKRPLGIPTIADRVVQMAVKIVIEPIFEADFCDNSYGFRPGKSAHEAVNAVSHNLNRGYRQVVDADLSKYFDTIPHDKLLKVVAKRISDGKILSLLKMWLKAPVVEKYDCGVIRYIGGGKKSRRGTPQGGVISPLLANVYLHLLDRIWERHQLSERLGASLVRYADDFVILCKDNTQEALDLVKEILSRLGLQLNTEKTKVVDACQESFDFLGFELKVSRSINTGNLYANVQPSRKSMGNIKQHLKYCTRRALTSVPLDAVVGHLNRVLRGWVNYFHYGHCSRRLCHLKYYVEERLRAHLRKRYKVRSRYIGYKQFTSRMMYERYNLYKVPTSAGWTKAHAL